MAEILRAGSLAQYPGLEDFSLYEYEDSVLLFLYGRCLYWERGAQDLIS